MKQLLFGTAGASEELSGSRATTGDGIRRVWEVGLGCMELEFVHGVRMTSQRAEMVNSLARDYGIALSAHAPYYINLNSREPEKVVASKERILKTARIAGICGARSVVFHPAFYHSQPPEQVYETVKANLIDVLEVLRKEKNTVTLRPELTGRVSQFGTLRELIRLCSELEGTAIAIDFAHLHARTGHYNTYSEFLNVLGQVERGLGKGAIKDLHIHVSGIAYSDKGEVKHVDFEESDFNYLDFIQALVEVGAAGLVISETPHMERGARLLQEAYLSISKSKR